VIADAGLVIVAVYYARQFIGEEPFGVLLGDDIVQSKTPCLQQLTELYDEVQSSVLAVMEVPEQDVNKYGILDAVEEKPGVYRVLDLVEKPPVGKAPSRLAIMGRYVLEPGIFPILADTKPGAGGEIQLTDALRVLCREKPIYGLAFEGKRYDVGDKLGYLKATVEFTPLAYFDKFGDLPARQAFNWENTGALIRSCPASPLTSTT
jgi:UTP--glucose-1-phosphate uridylyltransferase